MGQTAGSICLKRTRASLASCSATRCSRSPNFYPTSWHDGQPHVHVTTLAPRWHLLRIEIVPGSTGKLPDEHVKMLPPEYGLATTVAETTKNQFVFRKTGKRPNGSKWAHCAETTIKTDKCSGEYPSVVGSFDEVGLSVSYCYGYRVDDVGSGAARQLSHYPRKRPPLCGRFPYRSLLERIQPPSIRPISSISASDSDLFAKKVCAKEIFGSNLLLGEKQVRASAPKILNSFGKMGENQWDALRASHLLALKKPLSSVLVRDARIELAPPAWEAEVLPLN